MTPANEEGPDANRRALEITTAKDDSTQREAAEWPSKPSFRPARRPGAVRSRNLGRSVSPVEPGRDLLRLSAWCPSSTSGLHGPYFHHRCVRCERPVSVSGAV